MYRNTKESNQSRLIDILINFYKCENRLITKKNP